jgi:hypothetical protein
MVPSDNQKLAQTKCCVEELENMKIECINCKYRYKYNHLSEEKKREYYELLNKLLNKIHVCEQDFIDLQ